jgi:hypothetical protein
MIPLGSQERVPAVGSLTWARSEWQSAAGDAERLRRSLQPFLSSVGRDFP